MIKTPEEVMKSIICEPHVLASIENLGSTERLPLLTAEEERNLAIKFLTDNDSDAWNKLILSNLGFVIKIAQDYKHYNIPIQDIVQEGCCGLMEAIKRFDPDKNFRLTTFAVWWIKARIKDYIIKNWSLIKYGTTTKQRKMFFKVNSLRNWDSEDGRNNKIEELSSMLGIPTEDILHEERRIRDRIFSLSESPAKTEDYPALEEVLVQDRFVLQDEQLIRRDEEDKNSKMIEYALSSLSPREQFVAKKRYLIDEPWTLARVGESLGVSRERVRQVEKIVLSKIKHSCERYTERHLQPLKIT
jgi:RNA polymerase sigma-32 factor